jgi:hypothetical protein
MSSIVCMNENLVYTCAMPTALRTGSLRKIEMKPSFPPTPAFPFPPNGKPVPWTSRQIKAYQKFMRQNAPDAPF